MTQFFLILILFVSLNSFGYSYIDNRNLFPLGEKEMFMANSGVALTQSSGNVFYNPAGLADLGSAKLSLSSNTYFNSKTEYKSIQTLDDQNIPFSTSGTQSIPSTLVSAWKGENLAWAFSILVPHQLKVQDSTIYSSNSYEAIQITRSQSFQILMVGGTIAGTVANSFRLGASCFLTTYQSSQQFDFVATPRSSTTLKPAVVSNYFNSDLMGSLCHLGVQHDASDLLSWGLTLKSPLFVSSKKGTGTQFIQEPTAGVFKTDGPKSVEANFEMPAEVSAGIKWNLNDRFKVYTDANYQMAAEYFDGNLIATKYEHIGTLRVNGGLQIKVSEKNELLAGVSYNPSSIKSSAIEAQENYFVGSIGFQSVSENSVLGIGVFLADSIGETTNTKLDAAFQEIETYKSSMKTSVSGVLVSSGFSF
jgi:long-subunit fatty acid transport protein